MPILRALRSPDGFCVVPFHWSHDKSKTQEWYAREEARYLAAGLTISDVNRELNLDFTATAGVLAYPAYRESIHLVPNLPTIPNVPIVLACDFNVAPMVWVIAQNIHGWANVLRTYALSPATIPNMVTEFRNMYPSWPAGLRVYGDSMGTHRDHQIGQTDYDFIRIAFAGYDGPIEFRVPLASPDEKDRRNAVNAKLVSPEGMPGVRLNGAIREDGKRACHELIEDFGGVVLDSRGKIAKTYDLKNPYQRLTHASDGFGYWINREFPAREADKRPAKPMKELEYGHQYGEI